MRTSIRRPYMVEIKLFTAPSCRHCREAINRLMETLESLKPGVTEFVLETIDIYQHPKKAMEYQVLTTPTLVLNDRWILRGIPKREKLLQSLKEAVHHLTQINNKS